MATKKVQARPIPGDSGVGCPLFMPALELLSLYPLLALNHLLAHCPCELNSGSNIFKKFAKSQGDPIEYDYKIQYYLS
jgi:hypothetical protein